MFCPNCGTQTLADAKFCASCGKPLDAAKSEPAPAATMQASAAPPAYNPPPLAQPATAGGGIGGWLRRLKTWQKVLLGIFTFIVLVVALSMWATSDLDEPVARHFAALRSGDTVGAYAELSVAARQQTSMEDFQKMLTGMPALTHVTGQSFSSRLINDGEGNLEGVLELDGGGKLPIKVRLVKENDAWKILAYNVTGGDKKE